MLLESVILRGTRAGQPAATTVPVGTLYFVTDEGVTERSTGAVWQSYSGTANAARIQQIGIVVDGSGSILTTGLKGFKSFPVVGVITGVRLLADVSGSIVFDIWKDTYANFPPTIADTIVAAAKPTITTAVKSEDTTLTGWTTSIAAGDVFAFNIDSVSSIKRIILELTIRITA